MRWVEKYKEDDKIENQERKPIAYKITKEHVKFILDELKNKNTITIADLLLKIKQQFPNLTLSLMHLHRIIKDNNISLKLSRVRHEPEKSFGKDVNINNKLEEFYETIKKYDIKDIICLDETSISALQKRNFCYNNVGKRCIIKTKSQEVFKKYTGIFAISIDGIIG